LQRSPRGERLAAASLAAITWLACLLLSLSAFAAERKTFSYAVQSNSTVSVSTQFGSITVKPASDRRVTIVATPHSDKVEVDAGQSGNRVEARSHILRPGNADDNAVDYDVAVPADANLTLHAGGGRIRVQGLSGDVTLQSETGVVEASGLSGVHLHVSTVSGAITLSDIARGLVEATSVGGNVSLTSVSGPKVLASTGSGSIHYDGDPGQGGDYELVNHSGDIDVALPAGASVDLTARTVTGSLQNDFPLQPKMHTSFAPDVHSYAGTAASGSCMIRLSSFSGKIRVRKK